MSNGSPRVQVARDRRVIVAEHHPIGDVQNDGLSLVIDLRRVFLRRY